MHAPLPATADTDPDGRYRDPAWLADRLESHLAATLGQEVSVRGLRRVSNGFSWVTWTFELSTAQQGAGRDLVFRIGPPDGLLAPYSATREEAILGLLAGTGVPVPAILLSSDDTSVFGAPFLVCERMHGAAFTPWTVGRDTGGAPALEPVLQEFVRLLAVIHAAPWVGTPAAALAGSTDTQTAAIDQVHYWERRYRDNQMECLPILEWALDWLKDHAPAAPKVALLHGDYRIGNFLTEGSAITAVLDWEMSHFGDPHEDIAWALYPPFGLPRLMDRSEVYARYTQQSGLAVSERSIAYYAALNLLKMTVINLIGLRGFVRGSNDTRLAVLGFLTASHLAQLMKAIRAAS